MTDRIFGCPKKAEKWITLRQVEQGFSPFLPIFLGIFDDSSKVHSTFAAHLTVKILPNIPKIWQKIKEWIALWRNGF